MKKVLLATSLVAMTATGALAQNETVGGDGRMGLFRNEGAVAGSPVNSVEGRTRVNFTLGRQGDNGLSFGGTLRISQTYANGGATPGSTQNGSIFIEAAGLRLTMGDIDGAVARNVGLFAGGLGFTGAIGRPAVFNTFATDDSGNTSSVRADYSIDGFRVSVSARPNVANTGEISAQYSMSGLTVGLGYHQSGRVAGQVQYQDTGLGLTVGVVAFRNASGVNPSNAYRVYGSYAVVPGTTIGLTHTHGVARIATGLGVTYSLGGGANFSAAVESNRPRTGAGATQTNGQIGVTFSF